uniref:Uncharacterized protein n=1 Tax=Solanum lycopersicum TaxID=4081 RepID=A0A3Q7HCS8_SOLLC
FSFLYFFHICRYSIIYEYILHDYDISDFINELLLDLCCML